MNQNEIYKNKIHNNNNNDDGDGDEGNDDDNKKQQSIEIRIKNETEQRRKWNYKINQKHSFIDPLNPIIDEKNHHYHTHLDIYDDTHTRMTRNQRFLS